MKGLRVWPELNGLRWLDLQKKKLDRTITRRFIPAVVILKESTPEVKYDVFDRLNTGGVIAEPMEIRNAVYQGTFTRLLYTLSDEPLFRKLWEIPLDDEQREKDSTYRRMDDLEIVLRFFALRHPEAMNKVFREYLSDFMKERNAEYKTNPALADSDRQTFLRALDNIASVFGTDDAFRKPMADGGLRSAKSAPLADAVMVALSEVDSASLTTARAEYIRDRFRFLCLHDEEFKKSIGAGTNGKGFIQHRIEALRQVVRHAVETEEASSAPEF